MKFVFQNFVDLENENNKKEGFSRLLQTFLLIHLKKEIYYEEYLENLIKS